MSTREHKDPLPAPPSRPSRGPAGLRVIRGEGQRRQDLAKIRAPGELRCCTHRSGHAIVLRISTPSHQRQRGITGVPLRVRTPFRGTELLDFRAQPVSVDRQCQANERPRELHLQDNGRPNLIVESRELTSEMTGPQCITAPWAQKSAASRSSPR